MIRLDHLAKRLFSHFEHVRFEAIILLKKGLSICVLETRLICFYNLLLESSGLFGQATFDYLLNISIYHHIEVGAFVLNLACSIGRRLKIVFQRGQRFVLGILGVKLDNSISDVLCSPGRAMCC